ncbi:hypothetical protein VaNZ11_006759 [Volvox africanus]|uniref:Gamma-butyrobetaine hydroxylase-like N-terminal domain-containing protein n=1 Tax=Volvox africanus TaxID=51714 RepID=A0ABQ5S1S7_9CHLO|nr:hypothetical protein VaNZ11_006759 [Volvox africanus]
MNTRQGSCKRVLSNIQQLVLPLSEPVESYLSANLITTPRTVRELGNLSVTNSAKYLLPPTNIRLLKKEKRLELEYDGDEKISLSAELLRVCSPSADTRRLIPQSGRERVVPGRRHVGIMSVEHVGNYAIRIHFDDLHSSGIFTWEYLAHLGGPGRWPAMRTYLRRLKQMGLSRDPKTRQTAG